MKKSLLRLGWVAALLGVPGGAMADIYAFCSTRVSDVVTCSELRVLKPKDDLPPCSRWARRIGGKGWSFANGRDEAAMRERHDAQCQRLSEIPPQHRYRCMMDEFCPDQEPTGIDSGVSATAFDRAEAFDLCIGAAGERYLEALRSTSLRGCSVAARPEAGDPFRRP